MNEISKDKIKKDNRLIEAGIGELNRNAFKLLLYMSTELVMENLEEQPDGYKLTFRHNDFMESIGYESDRKYVEVKKYLKELRNTTIELPIIENGEESGCFITGFIDKAWVYKKGFSTVKFDKDLIPYLHKFKVERDTTIMRYNLMKQFDSLFSMRIYELLIRWKNTTHKSVTIDLEELKSKLGVKGQYNDFRNFEAKVLKVAKGEINKLSDIEMDYEKQARGERRGKGKPPITHIEFSFIIKNQQHENEVLNENQIRELMELAEKRTVETGKTANEFYNYAFALTLDGCKNNKGFYKYMKNVLTEDKVFLGQISMFTNPDVRAVAQQKSVEIQNTITKEKKERREKALAEHAEIERLVKEGKI